ncbi:MAG: TonB-dependent receptor [Saprospiraceae bacterium]
MKNILLTISFLFSFFIINAQNGIIKGQLADEKGTVLEYANVLLLNPLDSTLIKGVVTNLDGGFIFEEVEKGSYLVSASSVGFNESYSELINSNGDEISINPLILTQGLELSEVTVTIKKPFIEMKADKIVVNVENSTVNSGNSAIEILQKSPGVIIDKDNQISLRGKQGVLVMINGKNQYLTGEELTRLLESMPAENIQSIEIITNPSAKYDAEGNAGIINIRLKKNNNIGFNGAVNAGIRKGQKLSYNTGLNFNYRSNKINIYGSGSMNEWAGFQDLVIKKVIPFNEGETTFDQNSDMTDNERSYNTRLGIDYNLSDKTTIGVLYNFNEENNVWNNDNRTEITGTNTPGFNILNVIGKNEGFWNQHSINFNAVHNFDDKGTSLTFDADYSLYQSDFENTYDNDYLDENNEMVLAPFMLRNFEQSDIDIFATRLDFTKSFEAGYNLELGAKLSMVTTDNDTKFEALENGNWENQTNRSNNFVYDENVMAAYANVSKSFGKINIQAGLRMEHTNSEGNSVTLESSVPREYTDFFPSLSLSHTIGEKHSLSYNYSRRINRPSYQDLNPFIGYLDDYTFSIGNPLLNPQYSNSFGVNYGFGNSFFVSANYSRTKDAITEVIEQFSSENKTFQTTINLDNYNSASLTLSKSIPWKEIGVTRINLTSFYNDFQSSIPSGTLDNQNVAYHIYIGNEFNLPADIVFELSGTYQSNVTFGMFDIKPQYGLDLGFSKEILKGNGSVKIGVDDIFYTRRNEVFVRQDDIILDVFQRNDTRRVKASFKYKFGNNKLKGVRRRSSATEDEKSRIKG